MWHSVKVFLFLPPLLFALDYVWLGVFASDLYKKELGSFLRMSGTALQPIVWAAQLVYRAIPLGIVLFVLPPDLGGQSRRLRASLGGPLRHGGLYGI